MRLRLGAAALLLSLFVAPAVADEATNKLAQEYVGLPAMQSMIDEMFSPEAMTTQLTAQFPPGALDDDKLAQLGDLLSSELGQLRPRMEEVMESKAAEVFTSAELQALIDFYQSPHGASVMAKMQPYFQQYMAELGPEIRAMQSRLAPKIKEIVKPTQ